MKSILLVNGTEELTVNEFLKKFGVDQEEAATIKALQLNQDHFIVHGNDFISVTKIPDLTPYERFQLEKYGNILGREPLEDESLDESISLSEAAYIYNLENPQS